MNPVVAGDLVYTRVRLDELIAGADSRVMHSFCPSPGETVRPTESGDLLASSHFAAWEEPELFATEIRAAFDPLR